MRVNAQDTPGPLTAFDGSGQLLALLGRDGRLKIFDTADGRNRLNKTIRDPDGHVAGGNSNGCVHDEPTCLAWSSGSSTSQERKTGKRKNSGRDDRRQLVIIGTSSGYVKAVDCATGEVRWRTAACSGGSVGGVAPVPAAEAATAAGRVLTAGDDCSISTVAASSGKEFGRMQAGKQPLTAVACSPDGVHAMAAGTSLLLLNLESESRVKRFCGHTMGVRCVAFAPSGSHAVSVAEGDSNAALWDTRPLKKAKKAAQRTAAVLPMDDAGVFVATCEPSSADEDFQVLAASEAGEVYVWCCHHTHEAPGQLHARLRARIRVGGGGDEGIFAARFDGPQALMLARGLAAKPLIERIPLPSSDDASADGAASPDARTIVLRPGSAGVLLGDTRPAAATPAAAAAAAPHVLGAEGVEGAVTHLRPRVLADTEPTLGDRVAALALQPDDGDASAAGAAEAVATDAAAAPSGRGPGGVDSLAVLLTQALRAEDRGLLERCLATSNEHIINNTVRRIAPADAATFLQAVVKRLQHRSARGGQLAAWIRALLTNHAAYLMNAPAAQAHLSYLYQTIEARLLLYRPLLLLSGRIQLVLAQGGAAAAAGAGDDADADAGPQVLYDESEDDGVEVEDPLAAPGEGESMDGSEDGWEDSDGADMLSDSSGDEEDEDSDDEDGRGV